MFAVVIISFIISLRILVKIFFLESPVFWLIFLVSLFHIGGFPHKSDHFWWTTLNLRLRLPVLIESSACEWILLSGEHCCRWQASFLNGGNPKCLYLFHGSPFIFSWEEPSNLLLWRLGNPLCICAAGRLQLHSPVFILCLVTLCNLGFRVQSLFIQISSECTYMVSYSGGKTRRLEPPALPSRSWCFSPVLSPSQGSMGRIGWLLVRDSFGRRVCWGHPQLRQFSY